MKSIKEVLRKELQLDNPIQNDFFCCYQLKQKRYLIFLDENITKENISALLKKIQQYCKNKYFSNWKSIIIIAWTNQEFAKKELVYFDNVNTFVILYLIDPIHKKQYNNLQWVFPIGLNYKKYVKKISLILKEGNY